MRTCVSSAISPLFPVSRLPSRRRSARHGTDKTSAGWPSSDSTGQAASRPPMSSSASKTRFPSSRLPVYFRRLLPVLAAVNHARGRRLAVTGLCKTFVKILRAYGGEEQNSGRRGAVEGDPDPRGVGLRVEPARAPRGLQRRPQGGARRHPVRGARTSRVPGPGTLGPPVQPGLRGVLDRPFRGGTGRRRAAGPPCALPPLGRSGRRAYHERPRLLREDRVHDGVQLPVELAVLAG